MLNRVGWESSPEMKNAAVFILLPSQASPSPCACGYEMLLSSFSLECTKLFLGLVKQELRNDKTLRDSFPLMDVEILKIHFQFMIILPCRVLSSTTRMLYKMKHMKSATRSNEASCHKPLSFRLVPISYLEVNIKFHLGTSIVVN